MIDNKRVTNIIFICRECLRTKREGKGEIKVCSEFNSYDWSSIASDFAKKTNVDESSKKNEAK